MDPAIIKKLNLKPIRGHQGRSFINNIVIYIWPNARKGWKTFLMECDRDGDPLPDGIIRFVSDGSSGCCNWGTITSEFILNNPVEVLLEVLKRVS